MQGLPVVVLRTARFFPEEDDMAHAIAQSEPNTKANEFLFRRLTAEDVAEAQGRPTPGSPIHDCRRRSQNVEVGHRVSRLYAECRSYR